MNEIKKDQYGLMHPHDLALLYEQWSDQEKKTHLSELTDTSLAELASYLEDDDAVELLSFYDVNRQQALIALMEPDDARDVLSEMDEAHRDEILTGVDSKSSLQTLLAYEDDEAGAHMTHLLVALQPQWDVKVATKQVIQQANEVESIRTLFVVDDQHKYLGAVSLRKLVKSRYPLTIGEIYESHPLVLDNTPIEEAIHKMNDYGVFEMPVCSSDERLLGMINMDDALEIIHEEFIDDYERLSALPETENEPFIKSAFKRLPWLLLLLLLLIPIAMVTTFFEEIIMAVAVLAFFQPLILDAAGDVATQTLAVTLRILSRSPHKAMENGKKEIQTGILTGLIMGSVSTVIAYFLGLFLNADQPLMLSLVVGLSLWLTVIISPVIGFTIPVILDKMSIDPAVASGPLITTLVDVSSLVIFFGLATILLGGL